MNFFSKKKKIDDLLEEWKTPPTKKVSGIVLES